MSETEVYNLYPQSKNSIYTTEHWVNTLSNRKLVTVLFVQQWRTGIFTIELDETEKERLLAQDNITLNDCGASIDELTDGWYFGTEIKNKDNYNDEELKEIHKMMFCDNDNQAEYDSEVEYDFDQDIMEYPWTKFLYYLIGRVKFFCSQHSHMVPIFFHRFLCDIFLCVFSHHEKWISYSIMDMSLISG